ncbi:GH32 C-terminal domain-containing protein [Ectobacillus funiculus]|uniref:GH32 C-terminal domain-containing protein n=1 Tax=Ectobacillus funiculus TaxID=137993 RepID=A0ABV5WFB1_9BACI
MKTILKLFVNDDELAMTSRMYPNPASIGLEVFAEGGTAELLELKAWTLKDIWS